MAFGFGVFRLGKPPTFDQLIRLNLKVLRRLTFVYFFVLCVIAAGILCYGLVTPDPVFGGRRLDGSCIVFFVAWVCRHRLQGIAESVTVLGFHGWPLKLLSPTWFRRLPTYSFGSIWSWSTAVFAFDSLQL